MPGDFFHVQLFKFDVIDRKELFNRQERSATTRGSGRCCRKSNLLESKTETIVILNNFNQFHEL